MIKLIVTDMDGTLLNRTQEISAYNKQAILKAQGKDIRFMIATGRNYDTIGPMLKEYGITCSVLLLNGAEIRDEQGNILSTTNIDKNVVKGCIDILRKYNLKPEFMTNRGVYMASTPERAKYDMANRQKTLRPEMTYDEILEEVPKTIYYKIMHFIDVEEDILDETFEVRKIITFHPDTEICSNVRKELEDVLGVSALSSFPTNVEINDRNAQKGIALKKVIEKMGISPEEVAVFGDGLNDLTLFKEFENCYAPLNAEPDIKALAKEIIDYNYNDGVGKKIMEII